MLSYVQGGLADIWKENILEDLKKRLLEYETVREFLADIKKEFGEGDKGSMKVVELKRLEQGSKTMEEFVQEFKRGMNGMIRRKLIEAECQLSLIEQWYNRAIAIDRNWRKSRREEERLRRQKDNGAPAPRLNSNKCHSLKFGQGGKKCLNSRCQ